MSRNRTHFCNRIDLNECHRLMPFLRFHFSRVFGYLFIIYLEIFIEAKNTQNVHVLVIIWSGSKHDVLATIYISIALIRSPRARLLQLATE